jgi:hypothetical protein
MHHSTYAAYEPLGRTRRGGVHGGIHYARGHIRLDYVAHEVLHAVWDQAKHEKGSICAADDEDVAYALDEQLLRIWVWLLKVAPPEVEE